MRQEIATQIVSIELEVVELAEKGIHRRNRMVDPAAREAFDSMIDKAGNAMATAYLLYCRATLHRSRRGWVRMMSKGWPSSFMAWQADAGA